MEMKLEVVPIGVTDIERAKAFYGDKFGFSIDVDQPMGDKRFVQATPPGSACSISFGKGVTQTAPGAIDGLLLVVADIQAVYKELSGRGVELTEPKTEPWGSIHSYLSDPDGNKWTIQQKPVR
ncbi:MAG TPA: glyoxalase superfamily protein [Candidatus Saccharimonadales bacterium]|nr:glyoxalase superfamily protein [Candidatus Saccharimonadales bacterium]